MSAQSKRTTLYASSRDKALRQSMRIHRYPRAGDSRSIVIVPGVDTIDATHRHTDLLNHSYYGDNSSIISDIHQMIKHGTPPGGRFGIKGVPLDAPEYWQFLPIRGSS